MFFFDRLLERNSCNKARWSALGCYGRFLLLLRVKLLALPLESRGALLYFFASRVNDQTDLHLYKYCRICVWWKKLWAFGCQNSSVICERVIGDTECWTNKFMCVQA
jgi:hypothetical protein